MSIWFEGSMEVTCSMDALARSLEDIGEHFVGVVGRLPGLSSVVLVEQGEGFVTIKTNEGLMKRTGIAVSAEESRVAVEFKEVYQAGKMVTVTSDFAHTFDRTESGLVHRTVISGVEAPGFLGFLYRKLGKAKMGKAFLAAYADYLQSLSEPEAE